MSWSVRPGGASSPNRGHELLVIAMDAPNLGLMAWCMDRLHEAVRDPTQMEGSA
jgi:hypothetical protein